ncbi:hypothetical protein M8818_005052 [Zalaria obscura]|uniref:Uncharacterized protein n=1 Tax=Zalaria obscura TaxID=2024903 RepID=A0ACC3SBS1_9PEZI
MSIHGRHIRETPDTIRQVVFQVAFQPVFYPPRRQAREQLRKLLLDGGSLDCQICQEKVIPDVETPHGLPRARMVNGKNPSNLIRLPCHPNHVMCDKCRASWAAYDPQDVPILPERGPGCPAFACPD